MHDDLVAFEMNFLSHSGGRLWSCEFGQSTEEEGVADEERIKVDRERKNRGC